MGDPSKGDLRIPPPPDLWRYLKLHPRLGSLMFLKPLPADEADLLRNYGV